MIRLFAFEFLAFLLATLNFRYCAKGHVKQTLLTDMLIAGNGFLLTHWVVEAKTWQEFACYVAGAAVGSLVGMKLTKGLEDADKAI